MTTITVYMLDDGHVKGFTASGHAGSRKIRGYDLVCCAVSALTQTGVNALFTVAGTEPDVKVDEQSGYLRCILPDEMNMQTQEKADIVLAMAVTRECDKFNCQGTTSFAVTNAIFDALQAALIEYTGYQKMDFALIHPGGAVGKRLNAK